MQKPILIIGNKNYSSWSLRAWLWLKHQKIDFKEQQILLAEKHTKAQLANFNSNNRVPLLLDGDIEVWDSLAIANYVSLNFTKTSAYPKNKRDQALALSLVAEIHSSFHRLRKALPMNCRLISTPKKIQLTDEVKTEIARLDELISAIFMQNTSGAYLFGDDYFLADAFFAPFALRFLAYDVSLSVQTKAYIDKIMADENMQNWIQAANSEKSIIEKVEI